MLAALAAGLVPLLLQLRRTAQSLDAFLISSTKDLAQIAGDVHASRLRMDHLAGSLQTSVDELLGFVRLMGEAGRAVKSYHARFLGTVESASRNLGGVIGGISAVLAFFKRSRTPHEMEKRP
ncbi:MAG TPA: hypothetical protein VL181_04955 [Holophagaceae bacterium]|nr:hypothetical protein [Holophagaceae bacterium]